VIALLLIVEGLSSGLRTVQRLPVLIHYPGLTPGVVLLRAAVAVAQFTGGWTLLAGRPFGPTAATWVYVASAVLVTLEIGIGLAPTSLFPAYRWPAVALYWLYALSAAAWLRQRNRVS
jgi:hypothetical protein